MSRKEKLIKSYEYDGLGFPVILENVPFIYIQGEWLPHIDIDKVATSIFKLLPTKSAKLTGNQIKFVRTYLDMTKPAFAEIFKLSHTVVTKWEKAGNKFAPISLTQDMALRLFIADYLKLSGNEFYKAYKLFVTSALNEKDEPFKVAL